MQRPRKTIWGEYTNLVIEEPGTLSEREFDLFVNDLVNFLVYVGEPVQLERAAYRQIRDIFPAHVPGDCLSAEKRILERRPLILKFKKTGMFSCSSCS